MPSKIRRRLATSPLARGAALPLRAAMVARYDSQFIGKSIDWLVHDRETTNFTYELDPLNLDQLSWFVSAVSGAPIRTVRGWMKELENDDQLFRHVTTRLATSPRRRISAKEPRWGRRLGWYALIRALEPEHVVETGTHLGLGSCAIAAALLRNGHGHLTTIDIDADAGHLIGGQWASVVDRRTGDSIEVLDGLTDVEVFLHDSLHTYDYETGELSAVERHLSHDAVILSDNAHETSALSDWAERTGRQYLFFGEHPRNHWWQGDGVGAAWSRRRPVGGPEEGSDTERT
jgi:predicted O-methyltransferase YrrM